MDTGVGQKICVVETSRGGLDTVLHVLIRVASWEPVNSLRAFCSTNPQAHILVDGQFCGPALKQEREDRIIVLRASRFVIERAFWHEFDRSLAC